MNESISELTEKRRKWVAANRENGFEEGIKRLLTDLYPDNAHFIYELLQNAEDTKASEVSFTLDNGMLIFEHNGERLFNFDNINSITSIGVSSKRDDPTNIGKFGVGFKAVFSYTDTPEIHSGDYHFRIVDMVVPETENVSQPSMGNRETRFIFPFDKENKQPQKATYEVEQGLRDLDSDTLLFLENINTIKYSIPGGATGILERNENDNGILTIYTSDPEGESTLSHMLRFQKTVSVNDEDGNLKRCRIAIAYKLEKADVRKFKSGWRIIPERHGQVSIYFPAEKETSNLRFHLHAPFASTVARDSIRDCQSNITLRDYMAELIVESINFIKDNEMLSLDFLAILPIPEDNLLPFYEPLRRSIVNAFRNSPLTPIMKGGHAPAEQLFRGPAMLSDLINDCDLGFLTGCNPPLWVSNPNQLNQREDQFLKSLDIKYWDWKNLYSAIISSSINNKFQDLLIKKNDQWLRQFYLKLFYRFDKDNLKSKYNLSRWKIIKTSNNNIEAAENCFFPISDNSNRFNLVKKSLLEGETDYELTYLRQFFREIGVRNIGDQQEIEFLLDEHYTENKKLDIDINDHFNHIKSFIEYWKKYGNDSLCIFKDKKIFIENNQSKKISNPFEFYIDKPFIDTGLCDFFNNSNLKFKNKKIPIPEFYSCLENFANFSISIGVMASLEIRIWPATTLQPDVFKKKANKSSTTIDKDYYINGLTWHCESSQYYLGDFELSGENIPLSRVIWKTLCKISQEKFTAHYLPNEKNRRHEKKSNSYFIEQLKNTAWVPDVNGIFYKPAELSKDTLHSFFEFNNDNGWLSRICFGENKTKQAEEYKKNEEILQREAGLTLEEAAHFKELTNKLSPEERKDFIAGLIAQGQAKLSPVDLPSSTAPNPERRALKAREALIDAEEKNYEIRSRSVKTTGNNKERREFLYEHNSDDNGHVYCQLCESRMPFAIKNEDYFEAIEFVRSFKKEIPANGIALCPNCAAEYKYACATSVQERVNQLMTLDLKNENVKEWKIYLDLPVHTCLRFGSQKHIIDLQASMQDYNNQVDTESIDDNNEFFSKIEKQLINIPNIKNINDSNCISSNFSSAKIDEIKNSQKFNISKKPIHSERRGVPAVISKSSKSGKPTVIFTSTRANQNAIQQCLINIPDKRVARAIDGFDVVQNYDKSTIISLISKVAIRLLDHDEFLLSVEHEGIHITTLKMAIDYLIPHFKISSFGFDKYPQFISYIFNITQCATLYFKPPSDFKINKINKSIPGYSIYNSDYLKL